jgi:orotate phosphoribosyltransferase
MQYRTGMIDRLGRDQFGAARELLAALDASRGHFVFESGDHGDLWLDLETLFVDARRMQRWTQSLAEQASTCRPDLVCGPLTGGAFVAQLLATQVGAGFTFSERFGPGTEGPRYRIPEPLRQSVSGRRVLIVDDVVNAGSAVSSILRDLRGCGAELAGFAALLTLGDAASDIAMHHRVPLFTLASLDGRLWSPAACPLCRSGMPLVNRRPLHARTSKWGDLQLRKG